MEIRDHVNTDVKCRHCVIGSSFLRKSNSKNFIFKNDNTLVRNNYFLLWLGFAPRTGFLRQLNGIEDFMDHMVFSTYYAILQPYNTHNPEEGNNYELYYSKLDKSVEEHGGKLYYVRGPGYHADGTITLIIVPDAKKSDKWLITVLGGLSLYKQSIKEESTRKSYENPSIILAAKEEIRIVNALEKAVLKIHNFGMGCVVSSTEYDEETESYFNEAMDYLTAPDSYFG